MKTCINTFSSFRNEIVLLNTYSLPIKKEHFLLKRQFHHMGIKNRLILMSFLQFFVWGAWLITIGVYWFDTKKWSGVDFGAAFSTLALASIFMASETA